MIHPRFTLFVLLASTSSSWVSPSQADVAPPPDYVERCNVERVRGPGEQCESCGTFFREPNKCVESLGSQGFQQRCRTSGASVWTEIWCKPAAPQANNEPRPFAQPPPEQPYSEPRQSTPYQPSAPPPRGCGGCVTGSRPGAAAWLFAGAALAWVLQARRRR
jgi:hypothetical protein